MFSFFRIRKTDPKASLKKVLGDYDLPSFPGAIVETLRVIRNPNASASSVAEVLSVDPGLTFRVLKMANSPVFSPVRKIENLSQSIALVGLSQLESLVLSVAVKASAPGTSTQAFDFKRFWQASAFRGVMARALAAILCPSKASEAFTSGFLQDLALPFLASTRPKEYGAILAEWRNHHQDLAKMERAEFSWDHAEVGTWLCNEWDLPEETASAIGGHHLDENSSYDCPPPVALVALLGDRDNAGEDQLIGEAHDKYGIPADKTEELLESSARDAADLAKLMM